MKRMFCMLVVVALMVSLAGCGGAPPPNSGTHTDSVSIPSTLQPPSVASDAPSQASEASSTPDIETLLLEYISSRVDEALSEYGETAFILEHRPEESSFGSNYGSVAFQVNSGAELEMYADGYPPETIFRSIRYATQDSGEWHIGLYVAVRLVSDSEAETRMILDALELARENPMQYSLHVIYKGYMYTYAPCHSNSPEGIITIDSTSSPDTLLPDGTLLERQSS